MDRFEELLNDLESKNPETINLLHEISDYVEEKKKEEFDDTELISVEPTIKEEKIFNYDVLYQYQKRLIIAKGKSGGDHRQVLISLSIISIIDPSNGYMLEDNSTFNFIKNKILDTLWD